MRQPPLKAIEAVVTNRVDSRTRRLVRHHRRYFRCLNAQGEETDKDEDIVRITLSQRGNEYWQANNGGKRRIPLGAPTLRT